MSVKLAIPFISQGLQYKLIAKMGCKHIIAPLQNGYHFNRDNNSGIFVTDQIYIHMRIVAASQIKYIYNQYQLLFKIIWKVMESHSMIHV